MTNLNTARQILTHFKTHPDVRVIRVCGIYEVWRVEDGALDGRMAQYSLTELKGWAVRF